MFKKPMLFSILHKNIHLVLGEFSMRSVESVVLQNECDFSVALFHFTENSDSKLSLSGSEVSCKVK